ASLRGAPRRLSRRALASGGSPEEPVAAEEDERADDRQREAAQIEALDAAPAQARADEAADETAADAERRGHDDAAGIISRHRELRERTRDESEHNPRKDAHGTPPFFPMDSLGGCDEVGSRHRGMNDAGPSVYVAAPLEDSHHARA